MAIVEQIESEAGGRRRLGLSNPATLETVGSIEVHSAADVAGAVERAHKAQPAWAELGIRGARALSRARGARAAGAPGRIRRRDLRGDRQAAPGSARHRDLDRLRRTSVLREARAPDPRRPHGARAPAQDQEAASSLPAARRGRDHHALELPVHPLAESDRAGADRGQRRGAQAVRGHALLGAAGRAALPGGGPAGGRLPAAAGRRRDGRGAGRGAASTRSASRAASRTGRRDRRGLRSRA